MQRLPSFLGSLRDFLDWMLVDLNYEGISGIYVARVLVDLKLQVSWVTSIGWTK